MKLSVFVFAMAVSFAASADTIAWWHFDECDPGTTAPANTVGEFDAVRVSKGVLDPSQFMQRAKEGLMIFVR